MVHSPQASPNPHHYFERPIVNTSISTFGNSLNEFPHAGLGENFDAKAAEVDSHATRRRDAAHQLCGRISDRPENTLNLAMEVGWL